MAVENPLLKILQAMLALLLVGAMYFAGRSIYQRLPREAAAASVADAAARFELQIIRRDLPAGGETQVELYPMEYAALQREYLVNGRPGKSFEDFLAQRLRRLAPVKLQIDATGRGKARLSSGAWWMRATSAHANGEI